VGQTIRKAGSKVVELIDKPTREIEEGLIQVQGELGALGDLVRGLQDKGYRPTASETTKEVVITLITGEDSQSAVVNQIVDMLVAKHGGGGSIRDRARAIQQGNLAARCAARVEQIRQIMYRMEVDPNGEEEDPPGMYPTCQTVDLTGMVEEAADAPQPTAEEVAEAAEGAAPTTASEPEYVWVLASSTVNPNNEQTSFVGGGADPYWFPEGRFTGKSLTFSPSDGSFSVHDVDVDHEYQFRDATVSINFTSPPAQVNSGELVSLQANASSSGTVNEGGSGIGLIFQYDLNGVTLDPVLSYTPWNTANPGESSGSWTFTAPAASEGREFTLSAGLWNAPPCLVIWTYQAEER
jgi:hypothetical protein